MDALRPGVYTGSPDALVRLARRVNCPDRTEFQMGVLRSHAETERPYALRIYREVTTSALTWTRGPLGYFREQPALYPDVFYLESSVTCLL